MNRNKHLLLWSSLGVLVLLVVALLEEHVFCEWRQIQRSAVTKTGPLNVHLRQITVPGLRASDRCVTCHVGMAPGEQGVSGGRVCAEHPKVGHDPSDYGCTVCHAGQGRATERADAHGSVPHWPEPMIPMPYAYAGCGSCHTHLRVPDTSSLQRGRTLMERFDCLACHRIDNRGGTLRPDGVSGMAGLDLSRVGASGYDSGWYEKHLKKSQSAPSGVWKTSFGSIDETSRKAIEAYLVSRVSAPELVEAKSLFHTLGCRGCHKVGGVGGDDGPDLTLEGQKDPGRLDFKHVPGEPGLANWLAEHFRAPAKVVPGSQMPSFNLSEEQIRLLTLYMLSLRRSNYPEAYWPKDRVRAERLGEREFATDGATLYGTFCAACHGANGEGRRYPGAPVFPAIANVDFLETASDDFIAATVRHGRAGRRMPAWGEKEGGLRPEEIASVVAHLRTMAGVKAPPPDPKPRRWAKGDTALGGRLYAAQCASCHGSRGEGVEAPALNNKNLLASATDTYLVQTIARGRRSTVMSGMAQPSTVHPALTPTEIEAIVTFLRTWEKP